MSQITSTRTTINKHGLCYVRGKRLALHEQKTIVYYHQQRYSITAISKIIKRSFNTVQHYIKFFTSNSPLPTLGRPRNLTFARSGEFLRYLKRLSEFNPTWTHRRIAEIIRNELRLRVSESYIGRLRRQMIKLRRKRLTHVAKQRSSVRVQLLRQSFRYVGKLLPMSRVIFLDESHFDFRDTMPQYGYFSEGSPAQWRRNYFHRESYSLICAHSIERIVAFDLINTSEHGATKPYFQRFLLKLFANIPCGSIILLDNAKVHRCDDTIQLFHDWVLSYLEFITRSLPDIIIECLRRIDRQFLMACVKHTWQKWNVDESLVTRDGDTVE